MQKGSQHPFRADQITKTEYLLKKQTKAVSTCSRCAGVGCQSCGRTGKIVLIHETDIDIITALRELGLIKNNDNDREA